MGEGRAAKRLLVSPMPASPSEGQEALILPEGKAQERCWPDPPVLVRIQGSRANGPRGPRRETLQKAPGAPERIARIHAERGFGKPRRDRPAARAGISERGPGAEPRRGGLARGPTPAPFAPPGGDHRKQHRQQPVREAENIPKGNGRELLPCPPPHRGAAGSFPRPPPHRGKRRRLAAIAPHQPRQPPPNRTQPIPDASPRPATDRRMLG